MSSIGLPTTREAGGIPWSFTNAGDDVTFTIPDRCPACTPSMGTLLGTVR